MSNNVKHRLHACLHPPSAGLLGRCVGEGLEQNSISFHFTF